VADLCAVIEGIAPPGLAEQWDNVGLLAGSPRWPLRRVLLTIDLTTAVLAEARRLRCQAVLSYHPPVFKPVRDLRVDDGRQEGIAAAALAGRIAVYSPHTALDAAAGGTNDTLAALCGLRTCTPFEAATDAGRQSKLVVFVPPADLERVADAMFDAGAGRIGNYEKCSYRAGGQGTFFGTDAATPAVGRRGRLERVEEVRLEVIVPDRALAGVVAALRAAHSYEEPAFDVYPLRSPPDPQRGRGRIGEFARPMRLRDLAGLLFRRTAASAASIIGRADALVRRGLFCVGAAGSLPFDVPCGPGDVVITGEIRHHDALRYQRCGAAAIALGHWASERPVLRPLAARLKKALPDVGFLVSRADRDPFTPL
jgi:dinuclear metal center YbgI/SA1388 family protein